MCRWELVNIFKKCFVSRGELEGEVDASDGWDALVARLDAALPDGDEVLIIWP